MDSTKMPNELSVLLIGAGVIGSVYAGQLALAGCKVWVFEHGQRDKALPRTGIRLQDVATGSIVRVAVDLAHGAAERTYDLVIVAVQAEQLPSTFPVLKTLLGAPYIVFFGNNPAGHSLMPTDLPGVYELAFPGIAGAFEDGVVKYIRVDQQSTTLEASRNPLSQTLQNILESRGFKIERTAHMDGWLTYHAVFIACMLAALRVAGNDPIALGRNKSLLRLLCRAIRQGFEALKAQHVPGTPRALAFLHLPILRPIAVHYWGNIMRSGRGELYFAAHARHAPDEAEALRKWTLERIKMSRTKTSDLVKLLGSAPASKPESN